MKAQVTEMVNALQDQLISFASELFKIKSPTCHEKEAVKRGVFQLLDSVRVSKRWRI
ncbi:Hypothetical protein DEACI_4167 [Acididesulfobacillus acetoxydans]|uniref:Uncharacterized protein n=1 Tax=Acididesulfobacillus acetoxydans TaxID=1561005 RepID=A0A8S0WRJ5_9FIRM|nr:Hypothetical protein DEACI_4167 [Acididesulfobacillus acetoxydans]CEJ09327.1 Hypothetical protein DEACI_3811 [Acididesulfobacillus acetoxydans]